MLAYIICEQATRSEVKILQEASSGKKPRHVEVETVLQDADEFNRNSRNYPLAILLGGLNAAHIIELVQRKSWAGEFGHPNITGNAKIDSIRQVKIDAQFVSHRINKWWNVGNRIMGNVQGFGPYGKIFDEMIMEEMESAYSLRAVGSVDVTPKGNMVKGKLHVVTYDNVFVPSHRNAYQTKVLQTLEENSRIVTESLTSINQNNLQEMVDFLKLESQNIRMISEVMELSTKDIILSEDRKSVIINDTSKQCKVVTPIESYLHQEAVNSLKNFRI